MVLGNSKILYKYYILLLLFVLISLVSFHWNFFPTASLGVL